MRPRHPDLKGFSRELVEAFSTRAREIAEWMEKNGVDSVKAAQTAAYRTRAAKDHSVDIDERAAEWRRRAQPFGFDREAVEEILAAGRPRQPTRIDEQTLDAAIRQLELSTSHFDRRALLWAVAEQLPEGADRHALASAVNRILKSDRVLRVYSACGPLDADSYTTPRIAAIEARFVDGATAGVSAGVGVVGPAGVQAVLARHDYLGDDQREMVVRLTTGGEQIVTVAARPGTGKTTALRASAEAWTQAGFPVLGCATARTATGELIDAGIRPSFSICSLLRQVERWRGEGKRLPDGTVIVLDEANVTNTFDLEDLRGLAMECGGKLVLIGDPRQIGAIGPGGLYVHLTNLLDPVRLTTIRRQPREADQRIVVLVHEGRGSEALDLLRTEGKLVVGVDQISTLQGLLLDWHADYLTGADAVMIARRLRDVDYLNDQAHELRRLEGVLGEDEVLIGERAIAVGDRVQTRINTREVDNRERWDVVALDGAARTLTLVRVGGDGRVVTLGPAYLDGKNKDGAAALEYAYALTKFGAESKTFDRAYPLLDRGASLNEELVALSRGREIANVYTVAATELLDPDLGPARREVADILQDVRKAIEREGADYPAVEAEMRGRIAALSLTDLSGRHRRLAESARAADPSLARRDRLQREIAADRDRLKSIVGEREATERLVDPPASDLARLAAAELSIEERLRRNLAEREELPEVPAANDLRPSTPYERLEAALVEERISRETSKQLVAARSNELAIVYETLGPYPGDPSRAADWDGAAHAILGYRIRHNVHDVGDPLGPEPRSPAAKAARARASIWIEAARRRLQVDRVAGRDAARDLSVGR